MNPYQGCTHLEIADVCSHTKEIVLPPKSSKLKDRSKEAKKQCPQTSFQIITFIRLMEIHDKAIFYQPLFSK